ncbi:MAG: DUF2974 domain-containing protein [Lachnospiraceae bacterium]|nr:DUF2974 domain-containing protein [Lachnospiraceae bacterium]
MSAFSEEELLLLDNYIYMDCLTECTGFEEAIRRFSDPSALPAQVGGEMSAGEGADVLNRLSGLMNKGGSLEGLRITRTLNEGNVRAMCVVKKTGEAAVIFRGTGGSYEAWSDNVEGQYVNETNMQKIAEDFVKCDCMEYEDLTVSGHSKGGNLAQYVTVKDPDRIRKCVSFDGQGFSRDFIAGHREGVEKASGKIVSICAHNDYVNILLNSIAAETVYIANRRNDPIGAHGSYSLVECGRFDPDGRVIRDDSIKQGPMAKTLDRVTGMLTDGMTLLPDGGNSCVAGLLATLVGNVMSSDKEVNDIDEDGEIKKAVKGVFKYINGFIHPDREEGSVSLNTPDTCTDLDGLLVCVRKLYDHYDHMKSGMARLDEIQKDLSVNIVAGMSISLTLNPTKEDMYRDMNRLEKLAEILNDIRLIYESAESQISGFAAL